jgi:hypothetical protein
MTVGTRADEESESLFRFALISLLATGSTPSLVEAQAAARTRPSCFFSGVLSVLAGGDSASETVGCESLLFRLG